MMGEASQQDANPMLLDLMEIRSILEINSLPKTMEEMTVLQLKQLRFVYGTDDEKGLAKGGAYVTEDKEFQRILVRRTRAGSPVTPARLPAFPPLRLRPDRLPEGIVDIAFKEMDVPVVGDLHAGVA